MRKLLLLLSLLPLVSFALPAITFYHINDGYHQLLPNETFIANQTVNQSNVKMKNFVCLALDQNKTKAVNVHWVVNVNNFYQRIWNDNVFRTWTNFASIDGFKSMHVEVTINKATFSGPYAYIKCYTVPAN